MTSATFAAIFLLKPSGSDAAAGSGLAWAGSADSSWAATGATADRGHQQGAHERAGEHGREAKAWISFRSRRCHSRILPVLEPKPQQDEWPVSRNLQQMCVSSSFEVWCLHARWLLLSARNREEDLHSSLSLPLGTRGADWAGAPRSFLCARSSYARPVSPVAPSRAWRSPGTAAHAFVSRDVKGSSPQTRSGPSSGPRAAASARTSSRTATPTSRS